MGLTGALLVGGLLLVVLTGAVIAFLVERIRDSRLIRALNEAVTGMKSVEFERREELHYLCTELLHLSGTESTQLIDALLDGEKHQLGTLIRTVLERDMDALSGYHEQLADFTTLQLRRTGEALRRTQLENATDAEPDSVDIEIEPASASDSTPSEPEPSTEPTGGPESDDVEPSIPGQVESQEAQAPADAPSETEATVALVTDEANSSSPLLTPEEIQKGDLGRTDHDRTRQRTGVGSHRRIIASRRNCCRGIRRHPIKWHTGARLRNFGADGDRATSGYRFNGRTEQR
jgi:hypothetical protein